MVIRAESERTDFYDCSAVARCLNCLSCLVSCLVFSSLLFLSFSSSVHST